MVRNTRLSSKPGPASLTSSRTPTATVRSSTGSGRYSSRVGPTRKASVACDAPSSVQPHSLGPDLERLYAAEFVFRDVDSLFPGSAEGDVGRQASCRLYALHYLSCRREHSHVALAVDCHVEVAVRTKGRTVGTDEQICGLLVRNVAEVFPAAHYPPVFVPVAVHHAGEGFVGV